MELPKFMFVESPKLTGASFILSTSKPCILAKVLKFNNTQDLQTFKDHTKEIFVLIDGYKIAIQFYSTLPAKDKIKPIEDVKPILKGIAGFYLDNRIEPKKSFYKRYEV